MKRQMRQAPYHGWSITSEEVTGCFLSKQEYQALNKKLFYQFACGFLLLNVMWQCRQPVKRPDFDVPVDANIQLDTSVLAVKVISTANTVPWDLVWGPDHTLWYNEQKGTIYKLNPENGEKKLLLLIKEVWYKRTAGLLGMAVYKGEHTDPFLFVSYTYRKKNIVGTKLVRYIFKDDSLLYPKTLLDIPDFEAHYGTRIVISGDHKIYWATGDGHQNRNAQDTTVLKGKILRLNLDGTIPADNPIKGSPVWAWGFRNIQGLVFSDKNLLYTSEHGDAIDDEVNLIERSGNYGWPLIEGMQDLPDEKIVAAIHHTIQPLQSWTPTIAPSGMDFYNNNAIPEWKNSLLLAALKDRSLRVLKLSDTGAAITKEKIYLDKKYGRLRDVCVSPNGDVYISTSNRDWNPYNHPVADDDRILQITKVKRITKALIPVKDPQQITNKQDAAVLYQIYCAGCHKEDGSGAPGIFPSLKNSTAVADEHKLIDVFLNGKTGKNTGQQMPSFRFLSNREAAAILTFIRGSWGNNAGAIKENGIEKLRQIIKKKTAGKKPVL